FLDEKGRRRENLIFVAGLFRPEGTFLVGKQAEMDLALADTTWKKLETGGFSAKLTLDAPAGAYRLRVVVGEKNGGKLFADGQRIEVTDAAHRVPRGSGRGFCAGAASGYRSNAAGGFGAGAAKGNSGHRGPVPTAATALFRQQRPGRGGCGGARPGRPAGRGPGAAELHPHRQRAYAGAQRLFRLDGARASRRGCACAGRSAPGGGARTGGRRPRNRVVLR